MNKKAMIGLGAIALAVAGGAGAYFTFSHIPSNDFDSAAWKSQASSCHNSLWLHSCSRFTMVDDLMDKHPIGSSAAEAFEALTHPAEAMSALGGSVAGMLGGAMQGLTQALTGEGDASALEALSTVTASYQLQDYNSSRLEVTFDFSNDRVESYELIDRGSVPADWYFEQLETWELFTSLPPASFDPETWKNQADACETGNGVCTRAAMLVDFIAQYANEMEFGPEWTLARAETLLGAPDEIGSGWGGDRQDVSWFVRPGAPVGTTVDADGSGFDVIYRRFGDF